MLQIFQSINMVFSIDEYRLLRYFQINFLILAVLNSCFFIGIADYEGFQ